MNHPEVDEPDAPALARKSGARGALLVRGARIEQHPRALRGARRDQLHAARPSPSPRPMEVRVAHVLPGRVRIEVREPSLMAIERLASFLATMDGVARARVSPARESIVVLFDPSVTTVPAILAHIAEAPPSSWPDATAPEKSPHVEWVKAGLSAAVLASAITGMVPAPLMLGAVAASAIPSARRAFGTLREGRVNVDVMDTTAIAVCLVRADPITASVITTLLAIGDLILDRTHTRARAAISRLMMLDADDAYLLDAAGGAPKRVRSRTLKAGDRIVIYPGARVPADGVIVEGSLAVDEKALTGESVPRERIAGERVLAASVAAHGQAIVEIERAGGDTVAARIVRIIEGAGAKPMTFQRNAERAADRLVLPTFAVAGAAWGISGVVDRLTSVLITDFGTGVRIAVPTAALSALTLAARRGVLVKGASFLERLADVDTIVFDKTGTLTSGEPEVTAIVRTSEAWSDREIAAFAAAAESNQSHPIADAVRRYAVAIGAPAWEADLGSEAYRIGLGLEARVRGERVCVGSARMMRAAGIDPAAGEAAQRALAERGASSILVAVGGALAAVIGYADALRPESREVIARLREGGRRRVLLLSGDARAPVLAIARDAGIDEAIAEVLPADKADVVRRLRAEGRKVAMVGDGINDAPALALADVGISLKGGTEVALETADVVLLEGGLARLPAVFRIADDSMVRVKRVLHVVLAPNALAILAGALGFIGPMAAAIVNNGSTVAAAALAIAPLLRRDRAHSDGHEGA